MLPAGAAHRDLQLPVWNALYQVRDFAQYVNWVRAKDRAGNPLAVRAISTRAAGRFRSGRRRRSLTIKSIVDSPGPFGAQLNSHHAFLQSGAGSHVSGRRAHCADGSAFQPVPEGWHIATPLASSGRGVSRATNYDRLVDSPVEIGDIPGIRLRRSRRPLSRDHRRRSGRLRHGKDRRRCCTRSLPRRPVG